MMNQFILKHQQTGKFNIIACLFWVDENDENHFIKFILLPLLVPDKYSILYNLFHSIK